MSISSDSAEPSQAAVRKRMPFWFKLAAFIAFLALVGVTWGILFTESLVDVVDHQLGAFRDKDFVKAYSYTSKDFQETTTLDQLRHFTEAYPIFLNSQAAHFAKRSIKDDVGILRGNLTSQDLLKIPVEYQLVKEENKWKILSIRLLQPGIGPQVFDSAPLSIPKEPKELED